jgi:hypothetical protein
MESTLFSVGLIPRKLVINRELGERLRLGCSSGGNAADASRQMTAATKDHGEVAVAPKSEELVRGRPRPRVVRSNASGGLPRDFYSCRT